MNNDVNNQARKTSEEDVMFDFNDVQPLRADRPVRHDLDLIVRRLRDTAESWVPRLFPNGRRVGRRMAARQHSG